MSVASVFQMEVAQYLGQEANELLRHQPVFRENSVQAIDTLLEEVIRSLEALLQEKAKTGTVDKQQEKMVLNLFTTSLKVCGHRQPRPVRDGSVF